MKKQRQHLITQLLAENFVSSQEQLISLLNDQGINAVSYTHLTLPTNREV